MSTAPQRPLDDGTKTSSASPTGPSSTGFVVYRPSIIPAAETQPAPGDPGQFCVDWQLPAEMVDA